MIIRKVNPLGDSALLVELTATENEPLTPIIHSFCEAIAAQQWPFVFDVLPAFTSICVHYCPVMLQASEWDFVEWLQTLEQLPLASFAPPFTTTHTIPVCYDHEFALDLAEVAQQCGLSAEAVIALHLGSEYTVAMLGYAPGFPYMHGVIDGLRVPRRATPRTSVAQGSVALADNLCGIYPRALPGAWQIIGCTPVQLFDAHREQPSLLQPSDKVVFERITRDQFQELKSC
jgi:inhibitor of KinA